jgi:hypothetical protein
VASRIPTLIGITGGRGSGKDTAYGIIEEWAVKQNLTAARRAFADPLKWSFARIWFPDATLEEAVQWCDKIKLNSVIDAGNGVAVTGRRALQHYGYEAHREIFGEDFWIDQVVPMKNWRDKFSENGRLTDICVITDVRYDNEAKRIREAGGVVWKIERETGTLDSHSSEAGIESYLIDYTIINTDLDGFKIQVENLTDVAVSRKEERR